MAYAAKQPTVKPVPTACPKCGGALWDNRVGKKNPKAPDFKCRDKSCDGVFWGPGPRDPFVWADSAPVGLPATVAGTINPAVGDLPNDPASAYAVTGHTPLPQHQPVTPPQVALTAAQKALYAECVDHARQVAGLLLPTASPDTIAAMGATLYIQANNRRGL